MEGKILDVEKVGNSVHTLGEVSDEEGYFIALRIREDGEEIPLEFTEKDLIAAAKRAARNIVDFPDTRSFWDKLWLG